MKSSNGGSKHTNDILIKVKTIKEKILSKLAYFFFVFNTFFTVTIALLMDSCTPSMFNTATMGEGGYGGV